MTVLAALLFRVALIYLIIRFVWSFFSKGAGVRRKNGGTPPVERFKAEGETIDDGEFEEIR